ncbi:MAG TPA: hypothetical protein VGS16_00770 [Candidatus Dormibacteraeota bacterium]|nr:hypothetical protein [Candidatus Dormibacteraeota bacterium]
MYEPKPEEIVRLFTQWEAATAQSPNPKVAIRAPLEPPTPEEVTDLLPRLRGIQEELAENDVDDHGRPIADRDQAAMGQLWEEWRDEKLDVWNGYREIWRPNPFFEVEP